MNKRDSHPKIGFGTRAEADILGKQWVRYGAVSMKGHTGGLVSADGMREYRPPTPKPNSTFAVTGVQANFVKVENGLRTNGHLNITD